MKNQFAGGCAGCSVLVFPDGGVLQKATDGWLLHCSTCDLLRKAPDVRGPQSAEVRPVGCAPTLPLQVLGVTRECWNCGEDTTCVIGLYPAHPTRGYAGLFTTGTEETLQLARDLLARHGELAVAATIKRRYSRTERSRYLSNGCGRCDALQGNHFLDEKTMEIVAGAGLGGLQKLLVADCGVREWQAIVHHPHAAVIAI